MLKVRAICHSKALILTIPMCSVQKSNLGKICENALFVDHDVINFIEPFHVPSWVEFP